MKVKVDTEQFVRAISEFTRVSDECISINNSISNASEELRGTWHGDSKDAFYKEYNVLMNNMKNYSEILRTISGNLNKVLKQYEDADAKIASEIKKNKVKNTIQSSTNNK